MASHRKQAGEIRTVGSGDTLRAGTARGPSELATFRSKERMSDRPPYNPGVRELVQAKRLFSASTAKELAEQGFTGWSERGYLPHRDEPGLTQFVTIRLADSFPESLRSEWAALLEIEDNRERVTKLERYLDSGQGDCFLSNPAVAKVVEIALMFYHGKRYELLAWCVMSNHLHALFTVGSTPMSVIVKDWKKYTAREANKLLHRQGRFWAKDSWDTYMRDTEHTLKTRRYIESNPTKAKLVLDPRDWPWGSARFRDAYGRLTV